MAGVTEAQASVMRRRRSCNAGGRVAYTYPFMCPHKKKSNGVKSVDVEPAAYPRIFQQPGMNVLSIAHSVMRKNMPHPSISARNVGRSSKLFITEVTPRAASLSISCQQYLHEGVDRWMIN
ncbi:hypothetical protein AVEN_255640-1 [Araneus ventricosus]|uniref:Uncharacterized protein n=1 Tax=Araneus ventricosus TaxID=182803 RepID=A0A4Y2AG77_ARAVE|nr:hypothetical protein AVEN_255640-1 [Araneus ventricosus]